MLRSIKDIKDMKDLSVHARLLGREAISAGLHLWKTPSSFFLHALLTSSLWILLYIYVSSTYFT